MPHLRIREAAVFLGVSDDTVRRLLDSGALTETTDESGRKAIDAYDVAMYARQRASLVEDPAGVASSARNRFVGLVTDIQSDAVMSQVELQCGPFRVVSLMSTEAVHDLGLPKSAVAVIGDDIDSDVQGAQRAGLYGVLCKTGKYREEYVRRSGIKPDYLIDSIRYLPYLIPKP